LREACRAALLQVKGLQFNPFSPSLLASGAADGELCIWDLAAPAAPSLYPALKGGSTASGGAGEVTFLAWNCKVQHILASTSAGGTTVVWDLKRQRPVISFTDPNGARRCSALAWNPEVATQLITASDDDRSTTLQVWDLRNSISPAREFVGHSKGVLAMSWCAADPSLLLTCGKDNRTLCWDAPAGEVVAELPASSNWNFDVQWSPLAPGLLSASSFDGRVGVYNVLEASAPHDAASFASGAPALPMQRAPAWMRRPCGAAFGFGGRLVTFGVRREDGSAPTHGEVDVQRVAVDGAGTADAGASLGVAAGDAEFTAAVGTGDREALKAFCGAKAAASGASPAEAETWAFLQVLLDGENARRLLLRHLDYEDVPVADDAAHEAQPDVTEPDTPGAASEAAADGAFEAAAAAAAPVAPAGDDGLDFFENLPTTPKSPVADEDGAGSPTHASRNPLSADHFEASAHEAAAAHDAGAHEADAHVADAAPGDAAADLEIQRALVVGNYSAAVAACMRAARLGDALVLASVGGTELWLRTQAEYMRLSRRPYMKVVAAVVKSDLPTLVRQRPLSAWRETLAMLCTYAPTAEWAAMAAVLASRLERAGQTEAAVLCHICAGDIDAAVRHWAAGVEFTGGHASLDALRRVVEKSIVLAHTAGERVSSAALSGVVNTYAELLAAQGHLDAAMSYLSLVPGDDSADTAVLRDRIYRSSVAAAAPPAQHQYAAAPAQQQYAAAPAQQQYAAAPAQQHAAAAPASYAQHDATHRPAQQLQPGGYVPGPAVPPPPPQQRLQPQQQAYAPAPQQPYAPQQAYASQQQSAYAPPPQQQQQSYAPPPQQPMSYAPAPPAASAYAPQMSAGGYAPPQPQPQPPLAPPPQRTFAPTAPPSMPAPPTAPMQAYAPPPSGGAPHMFVPAPPAAPPPAAAPQPARFQPAAAPQQQQAAAAPRVFQPGAGSPAPAAEQAPPPAAPPPSNNPPPDISMDNVNTASLAPEARAVVASLSAMYGACLSASSGNATKKREMDDSSKRLACLLWKLNRQDVTPGVVAKLGQMCAALDQRDYAGASAMQVQLASSDWDECSAWMPALKRLLKTRQLL
jgi:protein transport protein SEC31